MGLSYVPNAKQSYIYIIVIRRAKLLDSIYYCYSQSILKSYMCFVTILYHLCYFPFELEFPVANEVTYLISCVTNIN